MLRAAEPIQRRLFISIARLPQALSLQRLELNVQVFAAAESAMKIQKRRRRSTSHLPVPFSITQCRFKSSSRIKYEIEAGKSLQSSDWQQPHVRTAFLRHIASLREFDYHDKEKWYEITIDYIQSQGGAGLTASVKDKLDVLMSLEFPEHEWLPWKFKRVSTAFWDDALHRRQFFDWLGKKLQITKMEDWYSIKRSQVRLLGGAGLLMTKYNDSAASAVMDVFPEHLWHFWRFQKVPRGIWEVKSRQREFMDHAAELLKIGDDWQRWYLVSATQLQQLGGGMLIMHIFNNSIANLVISVYPEHNWIRWKFCRMGQHVWSDLAIQREYFTWLYDQLRLKSMNDWYHVSRKQVQEHYGTQLLRRYNNSLERALVAAFPSHDWDPLNFKS